ncbi:MAG TPA: HhH-GPD-type base excision DNA repair protein [Ilumatobacter sp.]|nr:HhH-GPD-type base excision DNA repair protein [Ilumatobacter sp.]
MPGDVYITGDPEADHLLNTDGTAVLIGMLLDQQVPLEWAFAGPAKLRARLGHLDAARIAALPEEDLVAIACEVPAIHRFPAVMARRIQAMCSVLVAQWGGHGERVWADAANGPDLAKRLRALPGFGAEKTQITVALLAKRWNVRPVGWEAAAGVFADDVPRSIADIHDVESHRQVREWKAQQRAANLDKQGRPL